MPSRSRLFVGSSKRRRSEFWMRAEASKSRACWPPENELTILSWTFSCPLRFTTSSTSSIRGSISYIFFWKHFSKNSRMVRSTSSAGAYFGALSGGKHIFFFFFSKTFREKFTEGTTPLSARNTLPRDCDGKPLLDMYLSRFRLDCFRDKPEYRALAGAVLTHERRLRPAPAAKRHIVQYRFAWAVFERYILEPDDYFVCGHPKNLPYIGLNWNPFS